MVNPETGNVKLILMTEEDCHRFGKLNAKILRTGGE